MAPAAVMASAVFMAACQGPPPSTASGSVAVNITKIQDYTASKPVGADALIKRHRLVGADVGYVLVDLGSGARLAGRNDHRPFIPASTAKVPATVAALHILGPGYRFQTRLLAAGKIKDGVLEGDLYLKGGGDPLLQPQDLMDMAGRLKDSGVIRVNGRFFYDQSLLSVSGQIESAQPPAARYNPGVGALSLDFNQTLLSWRQPGENGGTEVFLTPDTGESILGVSPAPPGRNVIAGKSGGWRLSPMAPREGAEYLPVKKPGLRTARVFRRVARMAGVDLPEPVAGTAPGNARPLVRITGLPLTNVVRRALEYSNNLVSELIGQVAARKLTGKAMTLEASSRALRGWLKDRLPGIPWHGFHLVNHSGLTSKARVTPAQMAAIIRFAAGHRYGGKSYVSLLPVSGMRESMRGRFRDPATALRLWAKTGTLKYAKGLTGVLFAKSGNQIAFALYVTDYFKRRRYDADPNPQAPATQALADEWIGRAEALEESLVREWLLEF